MLRLVAALQATAEENERLQEENRASELRAMIGNVAHDLKTVSIGTALQNIRRFSYHVLFWLIFGSR
jgi:hypothetical protein